MMQLKEIGHVLLRVMDLERSKKFYSDVLGFHVLEDDPEHGGTFMALPGQSHAIATGIVTAGVAAAFWPAAPVFLLRKGSDVTINRGVSFDVFTDSNHLLSRVVSPPRK